MVSSRLATSGALSVCRTSGLVTTMSGEAVAKADYIDIGVGSA